MFVSDLSPLTSDPHPKVQMRQLGVTVATFFSLRFSGCVAALVGNVRQTKQNIVHMVIGPPTGYTA